MSGILNISSPERAVSFFGIKPADIQESTVS